ncbi:hypothetical protein BKK56_01025 [Rodentibacter genomosp. 2]|uniref:hypothetical protein n=1 Tax=Rodentibacter genomosp. 2 TaxID=1908266 RepID=UPI000986620E|nr:hypothetical protein BKK56_01025 [Rodentibacter genomosp. 2]
MMRNYKKTVLYFLTTLAMTSTCYAEQNTNQTEEPDYSETQWRTFYGKKPVDYLPEFWITYYASGDNEDCYKPNVVSVVDGKSRIKKKIYKEFIAEETDNEKSYVIRYPNRFKLGNCMYSSDGGQLYIEEKSDDPRLNQGDYVSKTKIYRRTISRGARVTVIALIRDNELESENKSINYVNKSNYNIFCHKINWEDEFDNINNIKSLICSSSSIENKVKKLMSYNSYVTYNREFWKNNSNIKFDFKSSKKTYCDNESYCSKTNLPKFDKHSLDPGKFTELYQSGDE